MHLLNEILFGRAHPLHPLDQLYLSPYPQSFSHVFLLPKS